MYIYAHVYVQYTRNLQAIMLFNFLCRKRIENTLFSVMDIWSM